jgi:NTP pyrophosphatase (non-canonical NTP hydrolase)
MPLVLRSINSGDRKMITQEDIDAFKVYNPPLSTMQQLVTDFALRMDQPINQPWPKDKALADFRWSLIEEEYGEAFDENRNRNNPENMFKELMDILITVFGCCVTFGWDAEEGFRLVMASNMSKLGVDGKPLKDASGKVLKGPNYKPANLKHLVETN